MSAKSLKQRFFSRFRANDIFSKIFAVTGSELKPQQWIFIIGCYNSGTTLLDQILSRHEQLGGLNDEGVMLTNKLPRPEDFGWRRMWLECEHKMTIAEDRSAQASRDIKRHWSHFYNATKKGFLEKSISNTPRAIFFNDYFRPAYFIHIVRNGYAVAEGIQRKAKVMVGNPYFQEGHYPVQLCARQWVRSLEVVEEQKSRLENFLEISYEALTAEPDQTLHTICDYLHIPRFRHSLKETSFTVHQNHEAIRNMNESSLKRLAEPDINLINGVAERYLKKYNYYKSQP